MALAAEWPRLLDVAAWLRTRPRPGVYLRQVDIPGVHSKLIETHRSVLSDLFDLALPPSAVQTEAIGLAGFCNRYGFREKPLRVRFRILDPELALIPEVTDQDITLTHETFARLTLPVRRVFITENETNFLAFPAVTAGMVIFGVGYGAEMLAEAHWLSACHLYYWGDTDTHGFAILSQVRGILPGIQSFLMDEATLLRNRELWGREPRQHSALALPRLTEEEQAVFQGLKQQRWALNLRLEQEHVPWPEVLSALHNLG